MQVKQQGTSIKRWNKSSKEPGKKVWGKVAVHQARMYAKEQHSTKQESMYKSIKSEGRCAGKEKKRKVAKNLARRQAMKAARNQTGNNF